MLEVEDIDAFYGKFQVLRGVTLSVREGETIGLFGPNGHGKTSILKTISGVLVPEKGTVKFNGVTTNGMAPERIVDMGTVHVPQGSHLFPQMTVRENLTLGAYSRLAWADRTTNLERVCKIFPQLTDRMNQKCSSLSGGERQMVAVGRGLMGSAKLLMLDEPTMGLAPRLARELMAKIQEIKDSGTSMILVEQNIVYVSDLADRVYLVENGSIRLSGKKEDVLSDEYVKTAYLGVS